MERMNECGPYRKSGDNTGYLDSIPLTTSEGDSNPIELFPAGEKTRQLETGLEQGKTVVSIHDSDGSISGQSTSYLVPLERASSTDSETQPQSHQSAPNRKNPSQVPGSMKIEESPQHLTSPRDQKLAFPIRRSPDLFSVGKNPDLRVSDHQERPITTEKIANLGIESETQDDTQYLDSPKEDRKESGWQAFSAIGAAGMALIGGIWLLRYLIKTRNFT